MSYEDIELGLLTILLYSGDVSDASPQVYKIKRKKLRIITIPAMGKILVTIKNILRIRGTKINSSLIRANIVGSTIKDTNYKLLISGDYINNKIININLTGNLVIKKDIILPLNGTLVSPIFQERNISGNLVSSTNNLISIQGASIFEDRKNINIIGKKDILEYLWELIE